MFLKKSALIPPCTKKCPGSGYCDGWCNQLSGRFKHYKAAKKVLENLKDPHSSEYE